MTISLETLIVDTMPSASSGLHYQMGQCLGEGGFARVFEAWDSKLCRKVAIKCLKNVSCSKDLLKEARMAASLRHPAFVKIYAIEVIDNCQSIVMELIEGYTLQKRIDEDQPNHLEAVSILHQIATAMMEAHQAGLIHGDLKPSNIMCDVNGTVRILDFGIAVSIDCEATTSQLQLDPRGTVAYMAPERLQNAPLAISTDIYALGVMFYQLLTGTRPFPHLSGLALATTLLQSSSHQWYWPDTVPSSYIALVNALSAPTKSQRIPTMCAVVECCEQLLKHKPLPIKTNRITTLFSKANQCIFIVTLAVGIVISLTGHMYKLTGGHTPTPIYSEAKAMLEGLAALRIYEIPGQLDVAEEQFSSIINYSPNHAAAAAGLSLTYSFRYLTDGQDELWAQKAEAAAQQALQLNDQLALSHIAYAKVLEQHGEWDKALAILDKADKFDPDNSLTIIERVNTLILAHRYDKALTLATQSLQHFPQERFFSDAIGNIHYLQGNYQAAEQAFNHSLEIRPDVVFAYANLNAVFMAQNNPKEALKILQRGLQVRPSALLYTNLGNTLLMTNDYVGAAQAYENAVSPIKGNPMSYNGWENFGDIIKLIPGRESESIRAYKKAQLLLLPHLKRSPNNASLLSKSALISAKAGEYTRVKALATEAQAIAPNSAKVNLEVGIAYELMNERRLAIQSIQKAIQLGYPEAFVVSEPALAKLRHDPEFHIP